MKSIGENLREAREAKDVTIPQISMELNISREYLVALEEEQFDIFPAETYLLGFLRNYADYLGLDVDKTVALYRNYKISEEPAPLQELVGAQTHSSVPKRLILSVLLAALLGAGGWFGFQYLVPRINVPAKPVPAVYEPADFSLDLPSVEWTLRTGDRIHVSYQGGELLMNISVEDNLCRIKISDLPGEDILLFPGDEKILPGGEGIPVVGFKLTELDEETALLQVNRTDVALERAEADAEETLPTDLNGVEEAEKILLSGLEQPESFTFNAQFNSYCLLRYQADANSTLEKYYRDGDRIRLDVDQRLMIWGSSAGAVSLSVSGVNLPSGKSGEVIVKLIQWVKNDEGKYDLVLFPVQ